MLPIIEQLAMLVHLHSIALFFNSDARPWVAGIHGDPECGAFSVALSGGYTDDIDVGEAFTFTGSSYASHRWSRLM
jgi:hypothetical protein